MLTSQSAVRLAAKLGIEVPVMAAINGIIHGAQTEEGGAVDANTVIMALLTRELQPDLHPDLCIPLTKSFARRLSAAAGGGEGEEAGEEEDGEAPAAAAVN